MMTTEEQIIAVAEFCGWERETRRMYGGQKNVKGWGFNTHLSMGHHDRKFVTSYYEWPAYNKDLNAMAEVEDKLTNDQRFEYYRNLLPVCDATTTKDLIHAKAHQRLEALCRTLWPERWKE